MKRLITLVIVCVMVLTSFSFTGRLDAAENDVSNFICLAYNSDGIALLSWEKLPFAESYSVYKNDKLLTDGGVTSTEFLDKNVDTSKTNIYNIKAYDDTKKLIAESFDVKLYNTPQPEHVDLSMKFQLENKKYWVNGEEKPEMAAAPAVKNGRSFLVIRHITDEVGAEIGWDGVEKKVTIRSKDGKNIELWIGKPIAIIDGNKVQIDAKDDEIVPFISEGRTLLPLRFVSDNLGADDVLWNGDTKEIELVWKDYFRNYPYALTRNFKMDGEIYLDDQLEKELFRLGEIPEDKISTYYKASYKFSKTEDDIKFEAVSTAKSDNNFSFMGTVTANPGDSLDVKSVGGEKNTFTYSPESNLLSIPTGALITVFFDEKKEINYWQYELNNKTIVGETESFEFEYISEFKFNSSNLKITETGDIFIFSGGVTNGMILGKRYKITYGKNWLGRKIITSIEQLPDPCDVSVLPEGHRVLDIGLNSEETVTFTVKNNLDTPVTLPVFVQLISTEYFNGQIIKNAEEVELAGGEEKEVSFTVKTRGTVSGDHTLFYGVKCGDIKIKQYIVIAIFREPKPEPEPEKIEIDAPKHVFMYENMKIVDFEITVKNTSDEHRKVEFKSYQLEKYSIDYSEELSELAAGEEKTLTAKVTFSESAKVSEGRRIATKLHYKENDTEREKIVTVRITDPLLPEVELFLRKNHDGSEITIDADIEWYGLEKGDVVLNILGFLSSKNIEIKNPKFPYKHKIGGPSGTIHGINTSVKIDVFEKGAKVPGVAIGVLEQDKYEKEVYPEINRVTVLRPKDGNGKVEIKCRVINTGTGVTPTMGIYWGDGTFEKFKKIPTGFNEMFSATHYYSMFEGGKKYNAYLVLYTGATIGSATHHYKWYHVSKKVKVQFPK